MKLLHKINFILFILNLILYLTISGGMFAQLVLGPAQLTIAFIITIRYYRALSQYLQLLLIAYWLLAVADLTCLALLVRNPVYNDFLYMGLTNVVAFPTAMCIAAYSLYITFSANKHFNPLKP